MFLKITRMLYFDTLNWNMTIAKRYKKLFSSYKTFLIYKKSENIADTIDVSENYQNDVFWHAELKYDDS